jgi:SCP-2 sterol transfer family
MREGAKSSREQPVSGSSFGFARLAPFVDDHARELADSFTALGNALKDYDADARCRIQIRLVGDDDAVQSWHVEPGSGSPAKPGDEPDFVVVVSRDTWGLIATGQLAPYDALFGGKLRVGGNLDLAKDVTRHLTNPDDVYVPPC